MVKTLFLHDSNNIKKVKDSFGVHSKIAETIIDIVNNEELNDCSFNIGLFGSWGSGKSYIINNIVEKLKENYAVFYIDVWKYVGHPLMRSILFDIDTQLKHMDLNIYKKGYVDEKDNSLDKLLYTDNDFEEEIDLKWNELFAKLTPIVKQLLITMIVICICSVGCYFFGNAWLKSLSIPIFSGLGFISAPFVLLKLLEKQVKDFTKTLFCSKKIKTYTYKPTFSPEQFECIFSDIVTNISSEKEKVLIVFDNLDRCEPKYAYETLSAIKTFMDKKKCLYIIPCDDVAIKKYISSNYNITSTNDSDKFSQTVGEEFFDKLFNTYIRIPQLQEIDRDVFIEEQLRNLSIYPELKNNINEIKQVLFYGYRGSTPRQIKRFINDFSLNYILAQKIDLDHKFLLNNLTLFAIMVVIKQKWSNVEEQLIKNPDLFSSALEENNDYKDYSLFIKRIKNLLPNKLPSIMPFIYLKETIDAKSVSNELKDGNPIDNISDSVVSRIKTEIQQMIENKEISYLQNASSVIFNTLNNRELADKNRDQLIIILGDILSLEDINFVDFIENISNNLDRFISYIPLMREQQSTKMKELCSKYLTMNNQDDRLENKQCLSKNSKELLFDKLTNNFNIFDEFYVSLIFTDFKNISQIDESIQRYVEILNNKGKLSIIPESFLIFIIDTISKDSFSDNAINCLKYFDRTSLYPECKENLANKLNEIITTIYSAVSTYSNQISLLNGVNLSLKLIDKSSFEEKVLNSFNTVFCQFINNLFSYNPEIAMNLLVETMFFVTDETDSNYENVLRARLTTSNNQQTFIKILKDSNYELLLRNIINCSISKSFLFGISEIRKTSYVLLKDSINELYTQLLREEDNSMEDLKTLLDVINENNLKIASNDFKNYIITKYYDEEKLEKTFSLYELLNNSNIKLLEKDFSSIKNTTIDYYKKDGKNGMRYLQFANTVLAEKQFNKLFLTPIFNFISNELKATKSVSTYSNIVAVINKEFILQNTNLLKEIVEMLLGDNQETSEYEFACNLLKLLNENSIIISEFQEIIQERKGSFNSASSQLVTQLFP